MQGTHVPKYLAWLVHIIASLVMLMTAQAVPALPTDLFLSQYAGEGLGRHIRFLRDASGSLSFQKLISKTSRLDWRRHQGDVINFGFTSDSYWFHVAIYNDKSNVEQRLLEVAYPMLDHISLFALARGEPPTNAEHFVAGDHLPFAARPIAHPNFLFLLAFPPERTTDLYLQVKTTSSLQVPLRLWQYDTLLEHVQPELVVFGLFLGCAGVLIFYHFMLFFGVRDRVYLYYALGLASYVFVPTVLLGLGYQYLWPNAVWWNDKSLVVVSGLALAFFSQFIKGFLNLERRQPRLAWLFDAYTAICVLCAFGSLVWPYTIMIQIIAFFVAMVPVSGYISGIRLWLSAPKSARLFVISWSLFVIAAVCFVLNKLGILPFNFFTEYTLYIGSTIVVILLSLALADRINVERQEKVDAQHAAIRHLEKYRSLYERSLEGLFRADLDGRLLSGNSALARLFGAPSLDQLVEKVPLPVQCLLNSDEAWARAKTILWEQRELRDYEVQGQRLNGEPFWGVLFARIVDEPNGTFIEGSLIDITERKQSELRLEYLAKHDALTRLLNRTEFEHRLQNALDISNKHQREHSLLFIDLDQFKIINDTCGHIAGDELLRQISILLRNRVRTRDSLARLGGDEFGILLESCSLEKGIEIAELLRTDIDDFRFAWNESGFSVGASIGVVRVSQQSDSIVKLLSRADTACYTAKDAGRNRVVVYREQEHDFIQRQTEIQMIATVRDAIDCNQLLLFSQPIVPITHSSSSEQHYEILVRMRGPDGVVLPGAFLPAAERYNLMPKLDRWVVKATLAWLAGEAGAADTKLACINLSGQTVSDKSFLGFVQSALREYGVNPATIAFEITENRAIANLSDTINLMQTLKECGVCFGLDDFGSGFSSYGYLRHLPIDFIKIDGAFVRHVAVNAVDRAVVKSITEIGHAMDLYVVAEFVENAKILNALKGLKVDFAQGFYYSQAHRLPCRAVPNHDHIGRFRQGETISTAGRIGSDR